MNDFDAIIVGAGFGGLHALHALRARGLSVVCVEAGGDVGGTWYWNRYPGARCDVESLVYCYTFSPEVDAEWRWSEKYAAQPEILRYMQFVADRLDLRRDIRFDTRIDKAAFDERDDRWTFRTDTGEVLRARHFVSATGPLSDPIFPDIPGREAYRGTLIHSGRWPDTAPDFAGKRVGVIGTGSSGTQIIPLVAREAEHLSVFIRTANYNVPARNAPLTDADQAAWTKMREMRRAQSRTFGIVGNGDLFMDEELSRTRLRPSTDFTPDERADILERRWQNGGGIIGRAFSDTLTNRAVNDEVSDFLRGKVAEIVTDPETAAALTPADLPYGVKRVCVGTDYYETFNRDDVSLVPTRRTPIERFTADGLVVDGREIPLDIIICASGFDALTGAMTAIDIRGLGGRRLADAWAEGPRTLYGISVSGFPNMYMIGGPGSPSVLVNVVMNNEVQVEWITGLVGHMTDNGLTRAEPAPEAQAGWTEQVQDAIRGTLLEGAESWYLGANVPGKPRQILPYAGGINAYVAALSDSARQGYPDFRMQTEGTKA